MGRDYIENSNEAQLDEDIELFLTRGDDGVEYSDKESEGAEPDLCELVADFMEF